MSKDAPNVFLSYASADQQFANEVRNAVAHIGAEAYDPHADLRVGENLESAIMDAVRAADVFVFVVPGQEGSGKYALAELGAARALGKKIVALVPDRARAANTDVAVRLSDLLVLDAAEKPISAVAQQVMSAVP